MEMWVYAWSLFSHQVSKSLDKHSLVVTETNFGRKEQIVARYSSYFLCMLMMKESISDQATALLFS